MASLKLILPLIVLIAAFSVASAYEPNKITSIYGAGSVFCEEFSAAIQEQDKPRIGKFKQWIYGYFTAVSMYYPYANNKHHLETTNSEGILSKIDAYCRKSPTANLHDAVKSLQHELLRSNKKSTE